MHLSRSHSHMSVPNSFSHDGEHKRQKIIHVNRHDDLCENILIRISVNIQEEDLDRRENINSNYKIRKISGA